MAGNGAWRAPCVFHWRSSLHSEPRSRFAHSYTQDLRAPSDRALWHRGTVRGATLKGTTTSLKSAALHFQVALLKAIRLAWW